MGKLLTLLKKALSFVYTIAGIKTLGSYESKPKINFYSRFNKNTTIGKNCHFNGLIVRGQGKLNIGNNFHSGKQCLVINSYHKYDDADAIPYDTNEMIHKNINIEDNVWIGDRVIILGGVSIGEGAIIQAGSVVSSNIEQQGIAGGNPATVFKHRDKASYEYLKEKGEFC